MRILIVRLSAMGDIIHTLPLAENAHRAGAEVGWLVDETFAGLLSGNPSVARLFPAKTRSWRWSPFHPATLIGLQALSRQLKGFRADVAIEAHGLWKSAILARLSRAPVVSFRRRDRREPSSAILVDRRVSLEPEAVHVVDQNLLLLSALKIPVIERAPQAAYLLARESPEAQSFLRRIPRPFALYHPGGARSEKAWGEQRYAELARRVASERGLFPIVSWGPGDEARAARLAELLPASIATPPLDFAGLAHVIRAASLFVAGDTGPAHLADALGRPTLALFGPAAARRNVPERNRPYRGFAMSYDEGTTAEAVAAKAVEILDRTGRPSAEQQKEKGSHFEL
jgi:heptosyltransferase I